VDRGPRAGRSWRADDRGLSLGALASLLLFFENHRLSEITVREVDRYKTAKASEGVLSANSINKTLTRLSQMLAVAVEYELIAKNPAAGKRRRLKRTKPRRPWVEPEQLPVLLDAAIDRCWAAVVDR
jgi:integrase